MYGVGLSIIMVRMVVHHSYGRTNWLWRIGLCAGVFPHTSPAHILVYMDADITYDRHLVNCALQPLGARREMYS